MISTVRIDRLRVLVMLAVVPWSTGGPFTVERAAALDPSGRSESAAQRVAPEPSVLGIQRLRQWLDSVERHEPGKADASALEVDSWSRRELEQLFADVHALLEQIDRPGRRPSRRLTPADTRELQELARREAQRGPNLMVKRGAMLHADIVMLVPSGTVRAQQLPPSPDAQPLAPRTPSARVVDGSETGIEYSAVHWDFARSLLDAVAPDPSRDEIVRLWYRATAAFFAEWRLLADAVPHLQRARQLLPTDAHLLVDSGCLYEFLAAPRIQNIVQTATLPGGLTFEVASARSNLRQAETFFRRALELDGGLVEARVRLGRVVGLQGRHDEAARELRGAAEAARDPVLQYYARLFLGDEEQALGRRDAARGSYEMSAALYPQAQSPHLALSQLARRYGDRAGALRAIKPMLELPPNQALREDPWWVYHDGHGYQAETLFDQLHRLFQAEDRR